MNLTITPMTHVARNNRIAFKSDFGDGGHEPDFEGPGISFYEGSGEGDYIRISRKELDEHRKHASSREAFALLLGASLIGFPIGMGCWETIEGKKIKNMMEQFAKKYEWVSNEDVDKDGNKDIVITSEKEKAQVVIDFYNGKTYTLGNNNIKEVGFTDKDKDGIPEVNFTLDDGSKDSISFVERKKTDITSEESE